MYKQSGLREFFKYTSLNVLGMIGLSCYILADTYFVSKGLGANGLAALNLAIPIYSFIHGTGLMMGMGGATKYSIFKSRGNRGDSNAAFTGTVVLALMFSVAFAVIGAFWSEPLTKVLGAGVEVFDMTNTYLKVILLFAPAFILNDVMICFVRNDGNPGLSMLGMLIGSLSNIVLDYVFMFPLQMGIFGAVLATGLAPIISMMILSAHRLNKKNVFHFAKPKVSLKLSLDTLSLGFPSLISEVSSGVVIIIFNLIILNLLGNIGVAAYGVIANLSLIVIAVYTGIAQGIQPLISKAYGGMDTRKVKRIIQYAMITVCIMSCVIYLTVYLFANPIAEIFNSEHNIELQKIATTGLRLYFTAVLFAGFNIIISVLFTSTERALPAHIISLLRGLLIIVPMAFLLSAAAGIAGVWLSFSATEGMVAIIGLVLYRRLSLHKAEQ